MSDFVTLAELRPQQRARVVSAALSRPDLQTRLYALGLYPGAMLTLLRFAPAGDPMQVRVGHSLVSIRRSEADLIHIEPEDAAGE